MTADSAPDEVSFRIGDVFPATDPVARYVAGVAMISNDWGRLFWLQESLVVDRAGPAILLYRIQIGLHLEAVAFMKQAERQYEKEIGAFVSRLPDEAREIHASLVDDAALAAVRGDDTRNQSFHYPQLQRDRFERDLEEMANLLSAAADLDGTVESAGRPEFLEYGFADEVALQMLPMNDEDELDREAIAAFRDRSLAFRRFAELVINQYVDGRPSDDLGDPDDGNEDDFAAGSPSS